MAHPENRRHQDPQPAPLAALPNGTFHTNAQAIQASARQRRSADLAHHRFCGPLVEQRRIDEEDAGTELGSKAREREELALAAIGPSPPHLLDCLLDRRCTDGRAFFDELHAHELVGSTNQSPPARCMGLRESARVFRVALRHGV